MTTCGSLHVESCTHLTLDVRYKLVVNIMLAALLSSQIPVGVSLFNKACVDAV
jgi:hypothetical protein